MTQEMMSPYLRMSSSRVATSAPTPDLSWRYAMVTRCWGGAVWAVTMGTGSWCAVKTRHGHYLGNTLWSVGMDNGAILSRLVTKHILTVKQESIYFSHLKWTFIEFSPPRLEYTVTGSGWHVGRVGQLIVSPGAIIHLDCLQDRRRGNPSWTWSHNHKEYPTGNSSIIQQIETLCTYFTSSLSIFSFPSIFVFLKTCFRIISEQSL